MDLLSSAVIVDKNGRRCDIKDILKVMKLKLQRGGEVEETNHPPPGSSLMLLKLKFLQQKNEFSSLIFQMK